MTQDTALDILKTGANIFLAGERNKADLLLFV